MTLQKLILYALSWPYLIISQHLKSGNLPVQLTNWLGFRQRESCYSLATCHLASSLGRVVESSHDVVVAVDEKFLFVGENHLGATVLGKENLVANFDERLANGTVFLVSAGTHSDNCAEIETFLFSGGKNDAALGLGDGFGFLDNDAVEQGSHSSECKHDLCISCVLSNLLVRVM